MTIRVGKDEHVRGCVALFNKATPPRMPLCLRTIPLHTTGGESNSNTSRSVGVVYHSERGPNSLSKPFLTEPMILELAEEVLEGIKAKDGGDAVFDVDPSLAHDESSRYTWATKIKSKPVSEAYSYLMSLSRIQIPFPFILNSAL